jgi:hypothetical protein
MYGMQSFVVYMVKAGKSIGFPEEEVGKWSMSDKKAKLEDGMDY